MKTLRACGEWLGGVVTRPRVYAALALPLALPLLFAATRPRAEMSPSIQTASLLPPQLRYEDLSSPWSAELPQHSLFLTFAKNDTLDKLLVAGGLSRPESALVANEIAKSFDVRRLRPGHMVRFHYDTTGTVDTVQLKVPGWGSVAALREETGFVVTATPATIRNIETAISATIDHSLYEALRRAGEGPQVVQQLVDIFQWDVDFFQLQKDDSFSLVVTKQYAGNDLVGYGPVAAARFTHKGVTYEAFRHEMPDGRPGYYAADARPIRKQFLKAPLQFSRVTSGFTKKRFHPVLKYFRPHYGVDYGAPVGTPVMTTADGVVVEARYKQAEGNFVRIRHSSRIDTYYLHLSRFAKELKKGTQVVQGDVIGYVGKTGLATGPHLDYRVREDGKWLDPLKLKSITPDPLAGASLRQFRASVARLEPRLTSPEIGNDPAPVPQRALF